MWAWVGPRGTNPAWLASRLPFSLPRNIRGLVYISRLKTLRYPEALDRTDDLFHAMEAVLTQIIDGTVLTSRQKRPNGRYLRAKCGQNMTPGGQRAGLCGTSPKSFILF